MKTIILIILSANLFANDLILGPMVGHVNDFEAKIWFKCDINSELIIEYYSESQNLKTKKYNFLDKQIKVIKLNNLIPNTNYNYKLIFQDTTIENKNFKFKTPKYYKKGDSLLNFKIAFGSCVDAEKGNFKIFEEIYKQKPDMMFWLGDNIYLKDNEWESESGFNKKYEEFRGKKEIANLFSGVANYAIWDDHDYGPNDSDKSYYYKDLSLEMFKKYWANPGYGLKELPGIFSSFRYNDVDFFITDNRFYRDSQNRNIENKSILGLEQLDWLINSLVFSTARVKVIVMGGLFLSDSYNKKNQNYISNYSEERDYLISEIKKNKIENVVILSGDKHFSEASMMQDGDLKIYEFTSSALTASNNTREDNNTLRIDGSLYQENNFCTIELVTNDSSRILIYKIFEYGGQLKFNYSLELN